MPQTHLKKAAGVVAEDQLVLLYPNTEGQGNFVSEWLPRAKLDASDESESLALALSYLDTGVPFNLPYPTLASVTAANTQPAVPAAGGVAAVAAVVPPDDILQDLLREAFRQRSKTMNAVAATGTAQFNFFRRRLSQLSWSLIEEHPEYEAVNTSMPKNGFGLYQIIVATHGEAGAGGIRLTSLEVDKVDQAFNSFKQGDLDLGEYYRLFKTFLEKRRIAGLNDLQPSAIVSKFYAKLDMRYYAEMLRERENTERALILANLPVPAETLPQALSYVRGWMPPAGTVKSTGHNTAANKKTLGVFAIEDRTDSVLVALKNSKVSAAATATQCQPLLIGGRPWTKQCTEAGCDGKHPFYLHQIITGKPCCAENQAKIDAYNARKKATKDKKDAVMVM